MKLSPSVFLAALVATASLGRIGQAAAIPPSLPNFDVRQNAWADGTAFDAAQKAEAAVLKARVPDCQIAVDKVTGSPKWIISRFAALTQPKKAATKTAQPLAATDAQRTVKTFLDEHRQLFGHGSEVLDAAKVQRDFTAGHNGMHTTVWQQQVDGIPVFDGVFVANTTPRGELISVSSQFEPQADEAATAGNPKRKALQNQPTLSAQEALAQAIAQVGEDVPMEKITLTDSDETEPEKPHRFKAGGLPGEARARLVWLPMDRSRLRLCWSVVVTRRYRGESFRVLIDAVTGQALLRRCLTFDAADATYRVFTSDSPSPFSPGFSNPDTNQPPLVPRSWVTLTALSTNASPAGWIAEGENETRGNNIDAHLDRYGDNIPDLPRPHGSPNRVFDFPLDLTQEPVTYGDAAVVQLFYWCNWMHDRLYDLGFTEAAGNFQKDNFGRGGVGGDPVLADAQDGSGQNNANFTTASDGTSGRIQMFTFSGPTPNRDADLDAEVILHEYTHGLSDRLVGGGVGLSQSQSYGMSEGWSDFYALSVLSEASDDVDGCYPVGGYMARFFSGLTENYYFGIRRYPVTTDMTKNPLTFKDIDPNQESSHPGIPRNPTSTSSGAEVHKQGEVWCAALWEARANFIRKYGFEEGNQRILQLVTDGMRASPPNPNCIQARDAILSVDARLHSGQDSAELWRAFAKRGLGLSATSPESFTTVGVHEAFDMPDSLLLWPTNVLIISGKAGGPFAPAAFTNLLINTGDTPITWSGRAPDWLTLTPTSGLISARGSNTVVMSINVRASALSTGDYANVVVFTNQSSGNPQTLGVLLHIWAVPPAPPNTLTEAFSGNGDFDLNHTMLTFTPKPGTNAYRACIMPAAALPTDPSGGTVLSMVDDNYRLISLAGDAEVSLYGRHTNEVLVGSNGDILFDVPTNLGYTLDPVRQIYTNFFYPDVSVYFSYLRLAPLYVDLNPAMGGSISWKQLPDRLAVTYENVPEFGQSNSNTFQVEWFFDGTIRFTYLGVEPFIGANANTPIIGLSHGDGIPTDFVESDFSASGTCIPPVTVLVPERVTEGPGPQGGAPLIGIQPWPGAVLVDNPTDKDIPVTFQFSDPSVFIQPTNVVIPAGQVSANFDLFVPNDQKLTGTRSLTITASAEDYLQDTTQVLVDDADSASLFVSIPQQAQEGSDFVGTVSIDEVPDEPVTVELTSSDPDHVQVPPTMVISQGETSGSFVGWVQDDSEITGPRIVLIMAHVANWEDDLRRHGRCGQRIHESHADFAHPSYGKCRAPLRRRACQSPRHLSYEPSGVALEQQYQRYHSSRHRHAPGRSVSRGVRSHRSRQQRINRPSNGPGRSRCAGILQRQRADASSRQRKPHGTDQPQPRAFVR